MQGQDGVDIEMNLNGSRSKMEDDDLDNIVCVSFNLLLYI
jgi:syntaxin 16